MPSMPHAPQLCCSHRLPRDDVSTSDLPRLGGPFFCEARSRPCRRWSISCLVKAARWRSGSRNLKRILRLMPISARSYSSSEKGIDLGCPNHSARSPKDVPTYRQRSPVLLRRMRQEVAHSGRLPRCSDSVRLWRHFHSDGGAGHAAQRTEHGRRGWHRHTGFVDPLYRKL